MRLRVEVGVVGEGSIAVGDGDRQRAPPGCCQTNTKFGVQLSVPKCSSQGAKRGVVAQPVIAFGARKLNKKQN